MTMNAINTENAMLISTTSGMPRAPDAARIRPFSSDMKPTTWLTALRRVTIISRPSRITASANARSWRPSGSKPAVTFSISTIDSATRPTPTSIVMPDADRGFDFAMNVEAAHDAPQRRGNQHRLERRAR